MHKLEEFSTEKKFATWFFFPADRVDNWTRVDPIRLSITINRPAVAINMKLSNAQKKWTSIF